MTITGHHYIAGRAVAPHGSTFHAINPATSQPLDGHFGDASQDDADAALQAADAAFDDLRLAPVETRAAFLESLAEEILALGDALLERAHAETALPMARLTGERGRAMNQCKMFAALIRDGSWAQASIDRALPDRQPVPKPDIRKVLLPIGPVVVFGASNFPFIPPSCWPRSITPSASTHRPSFTITSISRANWSKQSRSRSSSRKHRSSRLA